MTDERKIFKPSDASLAHMPKLGDVLQDFAFEQANEFINAGQSPGEAGSIVANLLIESAWTVAGAGVLADGRAPDADRFGAAVEEMLTRVVFKNPAEVAG